MHKSYGWLLWCFCHLTASSLIDCHYTELSSLDILHNIFCWVPQKKERNDNNLNVCVLGSNSSFPLSHTANTVSNLTHTHTQRWAGLSWVRRHLLLTLPEVSQGPIGETGFVLYRKSFICVTHRRARGGISFATPARTRLYNPASHTQWVTCMLTVKNSDLKMAAMKLASFIEVTEST